MQNYKEEEEEIERLVNRLVEGVAEDVTMDNNQGEDSLHELMDVDMGQAARHSPLLVDMCHYSDVSSADTSPSSGQNNNEQIKQGSEQHMQWHSDVNDPYVNCSEGVQSMEWQEGDGPLDNVSVLGPQNDNYRNKDIEMEEEEEEEPQLGDDDLTIDVFNFPHTFFHLTLNRTKSFKHKQHDLVNEQSYTATLRDNVITDPSPTLGDIHNQLYLMFHSLLEEIHNVYNSQDLVRVYITREELVNTNIIVRPDYLGNINADIFMNQIAYVVHSNNFIPTNGGLIINITATCNIKGLRHKIISNVWKHMHQKRCILMVENDDDLCFPHCIALAIAHAEHHADPTNIDCLRNYHSMCKKDRRYVKLRDMSSLQKRTILKYQSMAGIALHSPGLLEHIPLYEKALGVGITVISTWGENKRVYQSDPQYTMQIILYHIHSDINDWGHFALITHINALLGKSYYCSHCNMAFNNSTSHHCKV